jgi:putative transposon-encoded protein
VAGICEHGDGPSVSIKKQDIFLTSCVTVSFSKNVLHHGMSKQICV